jgi:hypothetical protein
MKKLKSITGKVANKQDIKSVSIDVSGGVVFVAVEFSRHTLMPADAQHPNPYTRIDNKSVINVPLSESDLSPELDALIEKIDTLV